VICMRQVGAVGATCGREKVGDLCPACDEAQRVEAEALTAALTQDLDEVLRQVDQLNESECKGLLDALGYLESVAFNRKERLKRERLDAS
jgi:uncharacterized protein YfbU (UPF0304 family)